VEDGIKWLEAHQEDEKETYTDYHKSVEDKIRPTMMKLYQDAAQEFKPTEAEASGPKGPKIEEVD